MPVKKTEKTTTKKSSTYICCCCGTEYKKQEDFFPTSCSHFYAGNNGFLPICFSCIDKETEYYAEEFGDEEKAIQRMCLHWDIYYKPEILTTAFNTAKNKSVIQTYLSKTKLKQWSGRTYDTTLVERDENTILSGEDMLRANQESLSPKKTTAIWGYGYSPEDYIFLNSELADWKSRVIIEGKAKETLVKDVCVLKLQQNKALRTGDTKLYVSLTDALQKTLDRANLTPKIEDAADKAGELPMGMMIKRFENERPIPEPLDEWKDVDGIVRMFTIYFLGHLCKMLGIKNTSAKMYEKEMAKYRVEVPELEDSDDDEVFDFIFNKEEDM